MKYCHHCQVNVNTERKTCPLCYKVLSDSEKEVQISRYPMKKERRRMNIVVKISIFLSLVACLVCGVVNYLTFAESQNYWSIVVIIGISYLWLSVRYVIMGRGLITTRIFFEALTTVSLIAIIEYCIVFLKSRETNFTLTYVGLSVFSAALLAIYFIIFINKKLFVDSIILIFTMSLLCFVPFIIYLATDIITLSWPPIASALVGVTSLIALFVFNFKETVEELKKRFHL